MNVRIIAGQFGTRTIQAPSGTTTHPMGERVRSALFNIIGSEIQGATVLDVFAGSGAIGLEALSRGAAEATFIEKDRVAGKILRENIERLGVTERSKLIKTTLSNWLETYEADSSGEFDIIFCDPPYHDPQFSTITRLFPLLKPNALMVLSHPGRGEYPTRAGVVVVDNRSYGNAVLTFYRRDA